MYPNAQECRAIVVEWRRRAVCVDGKGDIRRILIALFERVDELFDTDCSGRRLQSILQIPLGNVVRAGIDVGSVQDRWSLPIDDPMTAWSVSVGIGSLIGPIELELSQVCCDRNLRASISVGREL